MLDGIQNGNDGKPEEAKAEVPAGSPAPESAKKMNQAFIKDGMMIVNLYLEESDSAFASAIGSLVLAQDLIKNYFGRKAMAEAAAKARTTSKIILPGIVN